MNNERKLFKCLSIGALSVISACALGGMIGCNNADEPEYSPIESVTAIGYVAEDGSRLKAIALEYDRDMGGASITADAYSLRVYDPKNYLYKGNGNVGDIVKLYVNDKPEISETGGMGSGNYVILEMFTDYIGTMETSYTASMVVRATQVKDVSLPNGEVISAGNTDTHNMTMQEVVAATGSVSSSYAIDPDGFVIPDIANFKYYSDSDRYRTDGPAYVAENCFDQQSGKYYDEHLSYALCLPEDYHDGGNYAMITINNPAETEGTHPITSVLKTRNPSVYASEWAQELVKEKHDVDGLIVVVPTITERGGGEGGCTTPEYEAVVRLWDELIEKYNVDPDHVYATGQSVGGMELIETNRNRDNFFAGMLLYEDQWAQNYYPETIFERNSATDEGVASTAPLHYSRTNPDITWDFYWESDGTKNTDDHDPYNFYYLASDDNIMIMNAVVNNLSFDTWGEMKWLYYDTVGYELTQFKLQASDSLETQNDQLKTYLNRTDDALNINWIYIENGISGYSSRLLEYTYEWLLSQTRQTEIAREKLDINKPFELAETQIQTEERKISFTDTKGEALYFQTAKANSGSRFYSSGQYNLKTVADKTPGWLPDGMERVDGKIDAADIQSVKLIGNTAVAIEYNVDMTDLFVYLKGDEIIGLDGTVRKDITFALAPFDFYDADGKLIDCNITNVYVSGTPETKTAARGSGSGTYVILEFDKPLDKTPVETVQRVTVRTNKYISNAMPWSYPVE